MTDPRTHETVRRRVAGSRLLATAAVVLAAALPFLQPMWSLERWIVIVAAEVFLACVVAWLIDPVRFASAVRVLCFLIFLAYTKHMLDELGGSRPAHEAVIGFVVLGLPALAYSLFGRFTPTGPRSKGPVAAPGGPPDELGPAEGPPLQSSTQSRS